MSAALIALAGKIGAPIVQKILEKKIGAANAGLAGDVLSAIAKQANVLPTDLDKLADTDPESITEAVWAVEKMSPELVALYAAGIDAQFALAQAESTSEHILAWGWRPAAMWGFGVLWFWTLLVVPVVNAIWSLGLAAPDAAILFQLNAVYMGLYMGGHTVKDFVATRWGVSK